MPPSIVYVRNSPPSPVRRNPRNVSMSVVWPRRWLHSCGDECYEYADGVVWCELCGRKVDSGECIDMARGRDWNRKVFTQSLEKAK